MPDGEPGLLAVRGPVGCRYLADPRQREYVRDGWNITGDTYVRDPDGYFRYVARADDMIISAGYNIAGPEVEEALLRHPDVAEAAVVGRPDEERGPDRGGVRGAARGRATRDARRRCATSSSPSWRRTSARARSSSWTPCPAPPTGKLQRFRLRDRRQG